jgi:TetR/AcrR family transcriptional regulator, regulator of cefoperazone and chloramphenicol sensitivity
MVGPEDPTRMRLLEAAGEEFAANGFECARIRKICERAGANVSAVNYHFGDKSELYTAAVLHAHQCGADTDQDDGSPLAPPEEQLRCFIYHFLTRVLSVHAPDDWRHQLMLREMLNPTKAFDALLAELIRPRFSRLQGILRELCPGVDDRKLNALSFSVIGQCFHYRVAGSFIEGLIGKGAREALDRDYLTDHIATFCLAALCGTSEPQNESPTRRRPVP